ncbi:MAG: SIMPL domain-containing protein [Gemmatimonadaceae bacterium]|jgi:hypothetical protein|nr:SIMPL domain-containing protein [Gemmatimonadaceae bacterium]
MPPVLARLLAPALGAAALAPALAAQLPSPPPRDWVPMPPTIEVAGQGEAKATPDRAHLFVTVQVRARTANAAGQENATRSQRVMEALRGAGVPRELLSTLDYAVQPAYRYPGEGKSPILEGYDARNTVRVEVRQLEQVGRLIDVALGAGANTIGGVTFYVSNSDAVRRDALAAATADARLAAEAMAKAAGGSLGALVALTTESDERPRPMPMMMAAMRADAAAPKAETAISAPTEQTVTGRVVARWLFVAPR